MDKGWIKLNRQIQDHWIWTNHEYAYAWIDLLLLVNRSNKKILVDNEVITVKRGQTLTSLYKLSERWGWSRNKTNKFISALEKDGMVHKKSTTHYTMLTIVNYGKYQDVRSTVGTTKGTTVDTTVDTTEGLQVVHKQEYIRSKEELKEGAARDLNETTEVEEDDEEPPVPGAVRLPGGGWNYRPEVNWDDDEEET